MISISSGAAKSNIGEGAFLLTLLASLHFRTIGNQLTELRSQLSLLRFSFVTALSRRSRELHGKGPKHYAY